MNLAQEEHKDFILEYKKFQAQFDKLHWRKNPEWFLEFKEFKDETFKPIDEYQGFYFISNYGKVVSFKRKSPGERRSTMMNGFLAVSLNHFRSIKIHYIHELVFTHFVGKIKPFHRVVHKDKNITNNHYKNLEEVSITELLESKNVEKSDETSPLTNDRSVKVEKPGKPKGELDAGVLQFTREGKFAREYFSIREAARVLKINAKLILACLKGETKTAGDYQWLYRADPNFDDGIFDIAPLTQSRARASKPIDQYDGEGKFIREFPSVTEAAKAMGVSPGAISFSMQKPNRTAAGYIWKLKEK
jgi:hypothetical protein